MQALVRSPCIIVIFPAQAVITGLSVFPPKNGRMSASDIAVVAAIGAASTNQPHQLQPENYGQMTSLPVQFFPRCAME